MRLVASLLALALAAVALPVAAAHHTPDCEPALEGVLVEAYASDCVGARVVIPGECAQVIHAFGHSSCEYVLAVPLAPRMTCTEVASADLGTPATVGRATAGSLCVDAWAGQTVVPCPLVPTFVQPIPGGEIWVWPMCAAGVEWAAPLP